MIEQGFYLGNVWHQRTTPRRSFRRNLLMAYCDVDRIDEAPNGRLRLTPILPLFVRREDLLDSRSDSLRTRIEEVVAPVLGRNPRGPMAVLTQPRAFGLTFNPVSFVYCFESTSNRLEAIVAEVTNTPWGERKSYVLPVDGVDEVDRGDEAAEVHVAEAHKQLHVSPFFGMDHEYRFEIARPTDSIHLSIENHRAGDRVFRASLDVTRAADLGRQGLPAALRHPFMPHETMLGIYFQALRIALRRVPFHPHPLRNRRTEPTRKSNPIEDRP